MAVRKTACKLDKLFNSFFRKIPEEDIMSATIGRTVPGRGRSFQTRLNSFTGPF